MKQNYTTGLNILYVFFPVIRPFKTTCHLYCNISHYISCSYITLVRPSNSGRSRFHANLVNIRKSYIEEKNYVFVDVRKYIYVIQYHFHCRKKYSIGIALSRSCLKLRRLKYAVSLAYYIFTFNRLKHFRLQVDYFIITVKYCILI